MTKQLLRAALVFLALPLLAQTEDAHKPISRLPMGDLYLTLPAPNLPGPGTWEVRFSHRFNQSADDSGAEDLFGLDSGAEVLFGGSYIVRRNLQLALLRSNTNDTYEASAKWLGLQQSAATPVTLSLRGGADWRTEDAVSDRTSFFAQAILSKQFGKKFEIYAVPTIVTDAGRASDGNVSTALFDYAFNIPVGAAWMMRPQLALVAEIIPPNHDLADDMEADLGWSIGIKRNIGGHWFEVLLTNSQSTTVDQYTTTTFQGAPLTQGDLHLGFNIERRFGGRRR
jgi:hypothetical protein